MSTVLQCSLQSEFYWSLTCEVMTKSPLCLEASGNESEKLMAVQIDLIRSAAAFDIVGL